MGAVPVQDANRLRSVNRAHAQSVSAGLASQRSRCLTGLAVSEVRQTANLHEAVLGCVRAAPMCGSHSRWSSSRR